MSITHEGFRTLTGAHYHCHEHGYTDGPCECLRRAVASLPVEPEDIATRFLHLARVHAYPMSDERRQRERVPPGTMFCGTLWVTAEGEMILTDGSPNGDLADDHPDVHNCDEMGCSTACHVIARAALTGDDK